MLHDDGFFNSNVKAVSLLNILLVNVIFIFIENNF